MDDSVILHINSTKFLLTPEEAMSICNTLNSASRTAAELGAQLIGVPTAIIDNGFASVQVRVAVPNIAPFFPSSVSRRGEEPLEIFVQEGNR